MHGSELELGFLHVWMLTVPNPNWLPCKRIVELEETVSIHNHAKGMPDATMRSSSHPVKKSPLKKNEKKGKKKSAGTSLFFFLFFVFFFSGSFGPVASWNATDVIVASGNPFAWLWMLTVSSNSTICLHGRGIRVCNPTNPNWLPCKHIVELEETINIHNHAKGVPDATMT